MSSSGGPIRHAASSTVRTACDRCHAKKLRCLGVGSTCARCLRDGSVCVFSPAGKSGRPSKVKRPEHTQQQNAGNQESVTSSTVDVPLPSPAHVDDLPGYLFDDLETTNLPSLQPQNDPAPNDPTRIPEFDFSAFLLMPDGLADSVNHDELNPSTEPAPREHLVYEMLEHLTRLQSRLMNHRASLSETSEALNSDGKLTVPLAEVLDPFFSDTHQVADLVVYLNTQGSRFRHRTRLLKTISADTSCLLLCAPVMLVLDLYKQLLSLVDAALLEGKSRSLFTAAESPACSCCALVGRTAFTDSTPTYLDPNHNASSSSNAASSSTPTGTAPEAATSSSTNTRNDKPTPYLDAFAKLPEHLGGSAVSLSAFLSPGLRLWSLLGTIEYEVSRLLQATRLAADRFPLAKIGAPGVIPPTLICMRDEMEAVLKIVGETKSRCVVL